MVTALSNCIRKRKRPPLKQRDSKFTLTDIASPQLDKMVSLIVGRLPFIRDATQH